MHVAMHICPLLSFVTAQTLRSCPHFSCHAKRMTVQSCQLWHAQLAGGLDVPAI